MYTHSQIVHPGKWKPCVGDGFKHEPCKTHSCQLPKEYLWFPWGEWSKKYREDPLGWSKSTDTVKKMPLSPKIFLKMLLPWQNQWILQRSNTRIVRQYLKHHRNRQYLDKTFAITRIFLDDITKEDMRKNVKGIMHSNLFYKLSSFPLFVNQA